MVSVATNGDIDYSVEVRKVEVVSAALPLQEHWLPLSNLDLLLPPLDVGVVLCYKTSSPSTSSPVGALKKALAQVLVSYYALAGEVVLNSMGEPEILCNNRGVDFLEAYADVDLKDLNLYNPDESIEGKLVPKKMHGILAIQATQLRCGSLVVGCIFDHRISDAYSFNMFLVSWAETAQSKPVSILPSFRRSLFNPRRHGGPISPFLDDMYVPVSKMSPPPPPHATDPNDDNYLISRIYYVKEQALNQLQSLASTNEDKRTKLESFTAFLWQMIGKSANKEDTIRNTQICKMGVVVDGRMRLKDDEMVNKSSLMNRYFGNVLSIPFGTKKVEDLAGNTLSSVANEVHDFLHSSVTKEHFLGLIDWVEAHRPEPAIAKIYCCGSNDGPAVVISSGQRFPITKADFGWGMPVFGSYHFPWGGSAGYVMPMPSPTGNGDWVVYMHLFKKQLEFIENEAAHFFNPFTFDYLISI